MITFIKNDIHNIDIEKEIMNSNIEYNLIAHDKELLENEDILEEFKEAEELQVERYLVKKMNSVLVLLITECLVHGIKNLG